MFDAQKISFETFVLGYKHGVYVFSQDSCQACKDYQKELDYINNYYLYFVEVHSMKEMALVEKILGRSAFPITAGFEDNVLKFARVGIEYEKQQREIILPFLKKFGDRPLSPSEVEARVRKQKNKCMLTYYVFPPNVSDELRSKVMNSAGKYNELPIDISTVAPECSNDERERMLESQYATAKMVVFENGNNLDAFAMRIVVGYAAVNQDIKFIMRKLDEY